MTLRAPPLHISASRPLGVSGLCRVRRAPRAWQGEPSLLPAVCRPPEASVPGARPGQVQQWTGLDSPWDTLPLPDRQPRRSHQSGAPPSPGVCGAAGWAGAGREGRLPRCAHRSSCCPWSSTFWGSTPSLTTTQHLQTLQVGGSPPLFPQNTAPLQKRPGVCWMQVRPSEGAASLTWDWLPIGAVVTGAAGQLLPT